jgi:hypothetical protein
MRAKPLCSMLTSKETTLTTAKMSKTGLYVCHHERGVASRIICFDAVAVALRIGNANAGVFSCSSGMMVYLGCPASACTSSLWGITRSARSIAVARARSISADTVLRTASNNFCTVAAQPPQVIPEIRSVCVCMRAWNKSLIFFTIQTYCLHSMRFVQNYGKFFQDCGERPIASSDVRWAVLLSAI